MSTHRLPETHDAHFFRHRGSAMPVREKASVYLKDRHPEIIKDDTSDETGSLANLDDEGNHLFIDKIPYKRGQIVDVKVKFETPKEGTEALTEKSKNPATPAEAGAKLTNTPDQNETPILADAYPDLGVPGTIKRPIIKTLRMMVVGKYPNGDVMLAYRRNSSSEEDVNEVLVKARVPAMVFTTQEELSTADLTQVSLVQRVDDEVIKRQSVGWEDEYTLRLSGFSEAKSKLAAQIESDRQELKKAQEGLNARLKSDGIERNKLADERKKVRLEKEELDAKTKQLQDQIDQQSKLLKERDDKLAELTTKDTKAGAPASASSAPGKAKPGE